MSGENASILIAFTRILMRRMSIIGIIALMILAVNMHIINLQLVEEVVDKTMENASLTIIHHPNQLC